MDFGKCSIIDITENDRFRIVIPIYQTRYTWHANDECEVLFNDIMRIIKGKNNRHFLGVIAFAYENDINGDITLFINDGQQRITTICLILKAMHDLLEERGDNSTLKSKIRDNLLHKGTDRVKLKLSRADELIYNNLIQNTPMINKENSLIYKNYKFFMNKLRSKNIDLEILFNSIKKLFVLKIELNESDDNQQQYFRSFNGTGRILAESDNIRNYILMGLKPEIQDEICQKYWFKIEDELNSDAIIMTNFFRDVLTMSSGEPCRFNKIYKKFEDTYTLDNIKENYEKYFNQFLNLAKIYHSIMTGNYVDKEISFRLCQIKKLAVSPVMPLILKLIIDYEYNELSKSDLCELLDMLISYIIRRFLCYKNTNSLPKLFGRAIKSIQKENYKKSLKSYFISKTGNDKFPNDREFEEGFIYFPLYKKDKAKRDYILQSIEWYGKKEKIDFINSENITIEHILPQDKNLSERWRKSLGDNWKEKQEKYVHTIGNLTYTTNNPKLGTKSFEEKLNMENGYLDSLFGLSKSLKENDTWNIEAIKERSSQLFKIAQEIWTYPNINILTETIPSNSYTDWSNKNFNTVIFMGKHFKVNNMTEIYTLLIKEIYAYDKSKFIKIILNRNFGKKSFASYNKSDFNKQSFELGNTGIYISTKICTNMKKHFIFKLLDLMNIEEKPILKICI